MYSNNIVNFQESTTILNTCTKKSGNLLNAPHTHTHTHTHIYIYIYIYYMVLSVTLSFMQSAIVGQSEGLLKKRLIWLILVGEVGVICVCSYICVLLNVSMFVYVPSLVCTYVGIFGMYWHVSLHICTYFCCLLVGRGRTKEESVRRE